MYVSVSKSIQNNPSTAENLNTADKLAKSILQFVTGKNKQTETEIRNCEKCFLSSPYDGHPDVPFSRYSTRLVLEQVGQ